MAGISGVDGPYGEDFRCGGMAEDASLRHAVFTDFCTIDEHLEALGIAGVLSDVDVGLSWVK